MSLALCMCVCVCALYVNFNKMCLEIMRTKCFRVLSWVLCNWSAEHLKWEFMVMIECAILGPWFLHFPVQKAIQKANAWCYVRFWDLSNSHSLHLDFEDLKSMDLKNNCYYKSLHMNLTTHNKCFAKRITLSDIIDLKWLLTPSRFKSTY